MAVLWMVGGIIFYFSIERKTPQPLYETPMVSILVPCYNEAATVENTVEIAVQINGKTKGTLAIASLAAEPVQYPQEPAKEVFRALPDDNILERLFIANNQKKNEYIVASIGLTKSEVSNLSIKLSLTGYGYAIRRVNILKS
mgnify:CR=1 FL=1